MRVLVITSCTGEKAVEDRRQLTLGDFRKGAAHVRGREEDLKEHLRPAGEMYTGEQHVRLMRGVQALRSKAEGGGRKPEIAIQVQILSAGYGWIGEGRKIAPYECTFAGMKAKELRGWADTLKVSEGFRKVVAGPYDLGLVLLGDDYLKACVIDGTIRFGGPTLLFAGKGPAARIPRIPNLRVITLSNPEAKRFSCGLVGLKGQVAQRLLSRLGEDPGALNRLKDPAFDVLEWLEGASRGDAEPQGTKGKRKGASGPRVPASPRENSGRGTARANPKVDFVIQIPQSWWDKPHRKKLRYFIPEWDDLVDPEYDFLTDTHSGGSGDWSNEVYAHQMYPEPNYDGILMSRAVAEKSKKKTARINALGVHRFLRVPREFPIMGDCGAFDYIMKETPPYTTEDVLDYYTRLDFDYGVSVDHLIVTATEHQKQFRYELTIHNAEEFLKQHRKAGLKWAPIGAVQGWDPESYAKASAQYVKMGYRYLGLGGLVRTPTPDILTVLREVRKAVPTGVGIHLFGLARLNAIREMAGLGVTSVDSASPLRRAWLGGKDNFWTLDGTHYRAIRIPEAGKSFRAKRMVSEGRADSEFVEKVERRLMGLLRAFARGEESVEVVLDALAEYDHLITPDRDGELDEYRRTLQAKPWEQCPCEICQRDGIDVVIFRGNNRNRRRGFHNVYVFYRMLQGVLNGTMAPPERARGKNVADQAELALGL